MPQKPGNFKKARMQTLASMLAVGLDEERCTIFIQSQFGIVTELMWILSCTASLGYLSRMTQWKASFIINSSTFQSLYINSKSHIAGRNSTNSTKKKLGLFSYPVLQAADILIHRATHVPVGADQAQHLEFARECATNFNSAYSPVFVRPETILCNFFLPIYHSSV
ncbi:Tryptophan--tRNA ligase, mitochondrial [Erysiphe necator]|nr:Tryptophan--tRNA ligase, mitochondrial [Erysiphe necator]